MKDLFFDEQVNSFYKPLAEKVRPNSLDEFFANDELIGPNSFIRRIIETDNIPSLIFYGPPGVGKTTLAKIIATSTNSSFYELQATTAGIKEIKEVIELALENRKNNKKTIMFVDEIHRFNKLQQDTFLSYVEKGVIILIGATTENPSFSVNNALLSRVKVIPLKLLSIDELIKIEKNALKKYYKDFSVSKEVLEIVANISGGDARRCLNSLENIISSSREKKIKKEDAINYFNSKTFLYDKDGEEHYNLISALHKSMRNSDPDASLYYLARMLESGEDPLYIARRVIRFASEDVGLADPNAINQAISSYEATKYIGYPECSVNLAQAVVYMSITAKSNAIYKGYNSAKDDAFKTSNLSVPLHLRNAVTKLDSEMDYGKGYQYAHDYEEGISKMTCLPDELKGRKYYYPSNHGKEVNIKKTIDLINKIKNNKE